MGPADLTQLFSSFSSHDDKNVLVGFDTSDDAGVYRLNDELAIVQTLDLITPIVDDPYVFGQIAAANSLSDLYAMGAKPITALNIVCFDKANLTLEILREIMSGGKNKIDEAGASLLGGHTVEDVEMKYGLSATGTLHPAKILQNSTAQDGDVLIAVKPFGIGVLSTAMKADMCDDSEQKEAIEAMLKLNDKASYIALKYNASACTDITGFGLLGHLSEMSRDVSIEIFSSSIPLLSGSMKYAKMGLICGGSYKNRNFLASKIEMGNIDEELKMILFDAQTSGGLVFAVNERYANEAIKELVDAGYAKSAVIGVCKQKGERDLIVR